MQKLFQEYGGVITAAIAIVALIGIVAMLVGGSTGGIMGNAFTKVVDATAETTDNKLNDLHNATIPKGATYTKADGSVYGAGTLMPSSVTDGDIYICGDYKYTYDATSGGWAVVVLDKTKSEYSEILNTINGANITALISTFDGCASLTDEGVPSIPSSVTNMQKTFANCSSLEDASNIIIPESVTKLFGTFSTCKKLTTPPDLSQAINVNDMSWAFTMCINLKSAPKLPESVKNLNGTFNGCKSLVTAPIIPQSATLLTQVFYMCSALTGQVVINSTPTSYTKCISYTQVTEIVGDCPENIKTAIMATK